MQEPAKLLEFSASRPNPAFFFCEKKKETTLCDELATQNSSDQQALKSNVSSQR